MSTGVASRGGYWVLAQMLLLAVVAGTGFTPPGWDSMIGRWAGGIILGAGAVLLLTGALHLGRNLTPFPRPNEQAQLVRSGIYAYVRHPLYSSLLLAGIGWTLLRQTPWTFAATLVLAIFLNFKAQWEEELLARQFPQYSEYAKSVPRFIPAVWR